jgi:hypothetical protein
MHGNHSDSTVIAIQKKENPAKKGSKFSYKWLKSLAEF